MPGAMWLFLSFFLSFCGKEYICLVHELIGVSSSPIWCYDSVLWLLNCRWEDSCPSPSTIISDYIKECLRYSWNPPRSRRQQVYRTNFVVRWIQVKVRGSILCLYMNIHTYTHTHFWRLRPEWVVILECFLVKNLDFRIEQAWDQMLALPLQADQSPWKVLVLDSVVHNPGSCELPGSLKHFELSFPLYVPRSPTIISVWNGF